jgi:hypothetical protein
VYGVASSIAIQVFDDEIELPFGSKASSTDALNEVVATTVEPDLMFIVTVPVNGPVPVKYANLKSTASTVTPEAVTVPYVPPE